MNDANSPGGRRAGYRAGFTLVELLIVLYLLSVIATFTIPKVLGAQQRSRNVAIVKETAAMVAEAYQRYKLSNTISAATSMNHLLPYMNYLGRVTTGKMDDHVGYDNINCAMYTCLRLHNGGVLSWPPGTSLGGTGNLNSLFFVVDPDGNYLGGLSDSASKGVGFNLYASGRLTTRANVTAGTVDATGSFNPGAYDPSWFSW